VISLASEVAAETAIPDFICVKTVATSAPNVMKISCTKNKEKIMSSSLVMLTGAEDIIKDIIIEIMVQIKLALRKK
jgi:hypothetical protein